jgi:NADH-quinone oxidoreductase subunit H
MDMCSQTSTFLGLSAYDWTFLVLLPVAKILFIVAVVIGIYTPMATLVERKLSAAMQDRIGPNRAYIFKLGGKPVTLGGLFHTMADAAKMFMKEWVTPAAADKPLFYLAPILGLIPALVTFAVIPFGPPVTVCGRTVLLQIADINVGILFIFALGSLGVYSAALAGWASNNKMALLGALRASAQSISYEITFGLTLVGLMMVFQTVQLDSMVTQQNSLAWGFIPKWGVFLQPLGFILFFTASMAENKRIPFDLPEGESEIVGYFVEYSSMGFGLFMTTEFIEMSVIGFMLTTLFFGGYTVPSYIASSNSLLGMSISWEGWAYAFWFLQLGAFFFKMTVLWLFQFVIRWALPRFRYDQLMHLGWRIMLPLSLVNIGVTAAAILMPGDPVNNVLVSGLFMLGVFALSLFYSRTPTRAAAGHGHGHDDHGAHGHDSHGHDAHGHAPAHAPAAHH